MLLDRAKQYLNISSSDFDTFLQEIIGRVKAEFPFLFTHPFRLLVKTNVGIRGVFAVLKALPTSISQVKGKMDATDNGTLIPISDYEFSTSSGFFFTTHRYPLLEIEGIRGYDEISLPASITSKLVKLVAIEFKQSFQADGLLVFSGRTVGEVTFNYAQDTEAMASKLRREISFFYYVPDEIREEFL